MNKYKKILYEYKNYKYEEDYNCTICEKSFSSYENFRAHVRNNYHPYRKIWLIWEQGFKSTNYKRKKCNDKIREHIMEQHANYVIYNQPESYIDFDTDNIGIYIK